MSGFSASWLALREPYDDAARNPAILQAMRAAFRGQTAISVVDLACGTGATLRAISQHLPQRQNWRLVDNDLGLLGAAAALGRPPAISVTARPVDLAHDLELALDGPIDLITTSALLDLVSEDWLERLVVEAAARRLPVYAALTYDGRVELGPTMPFDKEIIRAVNRHQHGNKGFGPALGPDALRHSAEIFKRVGYSFAQGESDWVFGADDQAIQVEVLRGFAGAASELGELPDRRIADWLEQRIGLVESARSNMRVGHTDCFAMPRPIR
jgi:hypothetical protein